MTFVFLLEKPSMKHLLDGILGRILPPDISFITVPHNGKSELRKSIPRKLRAWLDPEAHFIIVQDQDDTDCCALKKELQELCDANRQGVLVRIACQELESWYFGDLSAVSLAYGKDLTHLSEKKRYRIPDKISHPKEELRRYLPELQQINGALSIGPLMDIDKNSSVSFHMFVDGILNLVGRVRGT